MIVGFTGCSGSGKTTISRIVVEKLTLNGSRVGSVHPDAINGCPLIPGSIADSSHHNIATDIKVLPWFLLSLRRNFRFFLFFLGMVVRYSDSFGTGVRIFRGVVRKIGIHRYLRRKKLDDWLVVVDEGIVHTAHNFLVHVNSKPDELMIERFSRLVPLPDIIVFIRTSATTLRERALSREDRSPRVKDQEEALRFVDNAYEAFERLMRSDRLSSRTLCVECDDTKAATTESLANIIVDHILRRKDELCSN
jgi:thymidylate kinase